MDPSEISEATKLEDSRLGADTYLLTVVFQATAEANNLAAVSSAKSQYVKEMEEVGVYRSHAMRKTIFRVLKIQTGLLSYRS